MSCGIDVKPRCERDELVRLDALMITYNRPRYTKMALGRCCGRASPGCVCGSGTTAMIRRR